VTSPGIRRPVEELDLREPGFDGVEPEAEHSKTIESHVNKSNDWTGGGRQLTRLRTEGLL
jgi:hypothetical protein